jgi:hypothetical protein
MAYKEANLISSPETIDHASCSRMSFPIASSRQGRSASPNRFMTAARNAARGDGRRAFFRRDSFRDCTPGFRAGTSTILPFDPCVANWPAANPGRGAGEIARWRLGAPELSGQVTAIRAWSPLWPVVSNGHSFRSGCPNDARQADALKLTCISQNFNDRRARVAQSD